MIKIGKKETRFMFISVMFISLMLISNLLAAKIVEVDVTLIGLLTLTPGIVIYPFSFMFGDVLTELYGFKTAKKVIWVGFLVQIALVIFSQIAILLPFPAYWENQTAMQAIFGTAPQVVLGSLLAYLFGSYTNAYVMVKIKQITGVKLLWVRTILSSVVGELFDSLIFVVIAFWGRMPIESLIVMIATQITVKILVEAVGGTPLAYLFINKTRKEDLANDKD